MIIDAHRHIGFAGSRGNCPVENVIRQMDEFQIDKTAVLPINLPPVGQRDDQAYEAAINKADLDFIEEGIVSDRLQQLRQDREDHHLVAQAIEKYPDRLIGVFVINPWLGQEILAEAEKAVTEQGFRGFKLHPVIYGFPADHEIAYPVLELAGKLKIPVMFHSSYGYGSEPWRVGNLAQQFPGVNFVLYHAGIDWQGKPYTQEAIKAAKENHNVWIDLSHAEPPQLQAIVDQAPSERVVFGSDDPFGTFECQLTRTLQALSSRENLRKKIMGENMALTGLCLK